MPRILTQAAVADFRDRLRHVAAELFIEMGHEGFNMRELAKRLGVSAMTPYRYFKDKDEILASVRAHAFARLADRLETVHATPGTMAEKCAALSRAYVQFAQQEHLYYRLIFDISRARKDELPEQESQEVRARADLIKHMRLVLDQEIFGGNPNVAGQVLWSALHGVVALRLAGELCDSEFDQVLSETVRVLVCAYSRAAILQTRLVPKHVVPARGQPNLAALPAAE